MKRNINLPSPEIYIGIRAETKTRHFPIIEIGEREGVGGGGRLVVSFH